MGGRGAAWRRLALGAGLAAALLASGLAWRDVARQAEDAEVVEGAAEGTGSP